jgi:hypothetical protein
VGSLLVPLLPVPVACEVFLVRDRSAAWPTVAHVGHVDA